MTHPWPELKWWDSGERQVVEEKYDDFKRAGTICNPAKPLLYAALSATPRDDVRVAIIGQDPYPAHDMATGVAFSVPGTVAGTDYPQTLRIIFDEYQSDLGFPGPVRSGSLLPWTEQGVLLWNAIPSCSAGAPLSHDWEEWSYLTREIVQQLSARGVVFALLGAVARRFEKDIDVQKNRIINTSHPSPRGIRSGKTPFKNSRLFSTINARLREIEREPINWELKDVSSGTSDVPRPVVGRGDVLPNITGAKLGGLKTTGTSPNIYTSLLF